MTAAQHAASLVEGIARLEHEVETLKRTLADVQAELAACRVEPGRLLTVEDFARRHGRPYSVGSLRTLLRRGSETRRQLEVCGAVVRRGRRVLIDEGEFFAWERRHARGGKKR